MRYWWSKWNFNHEILKKNWKKHEIFSDFEHFEGNASGFRLLRKKLKKLTFSTMATYMKYPRDSRNGKNNWKKNGIYLADLHIYGEIAEKCGLKEIEKRVWERHPLTYIMEASDDICYCDGY
jgi:dGTPase